MVAGRLLVFTALLPLAMSLLLVLAPALATNVSPLRFYGAGSIGVAGEPVEGDGVAVDEDDRDGDELAACSIVTIVKIRSNQLLIRMLSSLYDVDPELEAEIEAVLSINVFSLASAGEAECVQVLNLTISIIQELRGVGGGDAQAPARDDDDDEDVDATPPRRDPDLEDKIDELLDLAEYYEGLVRDEAVDDGRARYLKKAILRLVDSAIDSLEEAREALEDGLEGRARAKIHKAEILLGRAGAMIKMLGAGVDG